MTGWPGVTESEWREYSIGDDERTVRDCVDRMLSLGARAQVMSLFDELIREHGLDRFVGRIAAE